ncbi:MAG: hypothetical protein AB7T63_00345 [Planctomycetota bacterium]
MIALDGGTHARVTALQRAIDAPSVSAIEGIKQNMRILRDLKVAPKATLDRLEKMAHRHAKKLGI